MLNAMHTDRFIKAVIGDDGTAGHLVTPDDELRAYTAALQLLEELGDRIATRTLSPTPACYFALKVEQAHRVSGYEQILAADLAQRTLANELTVAQIDRIQLLASNPAGYIAGKDRLPDDPATVPTGRPTFKSPVEFMQNVLCIPFAEARDRVQSAGHLLPHTDVNGIELPPRFPKLADELAKRKAAPGVVRGAAKKLNSLRPHIDQQPNSGKLATDLEEQVADSIRVEDPGTTRQLLKTIQHALEQRTGDPSEEVLHTLLGLFYRGMRSGVAEFLLRLTPSDAEFLLSLCSQTDNPRTKAGDRTGLLRQSKTGAAAQPAENTSKDADPCETKSRNPGFPGETDATNLPGDTASTGTTFPDFLVAPSPATGRALATPEELAGLGLDEDASSQTNSTGSPSADRFEELNQTTLGSDGLTPPQRHLQGLLNLLKSNGQAATGKKTTGLPSPELVIIATLSELEDRATSSGVTQHGQHLSPAELRQVLCNCRAIPMVMDGQSRILDLGRAERYFPDYMRQAILARDRGCIVPGCTVPPEHCEIHHLEPWENGGLTRVEDGTAHCSRHHHAVHAGQLMDTKNGDGLPAVILPRFMDPEQKPRRNAYWNPVVSIDPPTLF